MTNAAGRWRDELAKWAIPAEILAAAPASPWGYPTGLFADFAEVALAAPATPSRRRALEALEGGGSVLDVGVGAGAASLPLAPPATGITGVDASADMLGAFSGLAAARRIASVTVEGSWPAVAADAAPADVVVCHHVFYNVAELAPFVEALTAKARRRVVVEVTAEHPQATLNGLWRRFHALQRPSGPTADDAAAVIAATGASVVTERFVPPAASHHAPHVEFVRRRLCLPAERDAEVAAAIRDDARILAPRSLVTLWWDA